MAMTYKQLRNLTDAQVEELHDHDHQYVQVGMEWYRDELHRRQEDKRVRTMVNLTWIIAGLTLANTALVAITLWE